MEEGSLCSIVLIEEAALSGTERLESKPEPVLTELEEGALYSAVLKEDKEAAVSGAEKLEPDLKELTSDEISLRLTSGAEYWLEVKVDAASGAE